MANWHPLFVPLPAERIADQPLHIVEHIADRPLRIISRPVPFCVKRCNVVHWFGTRDAEHTYWNSILSLKTPIDKYLRFLYSCICSQYSIQMMHLEI